MTMPPGSFNPVSAPRAAPGGASPSLSYWQDAWLRLRANRRALASLCLVAALVLFVLVGPLVWRVDPKARNMAQLSMPPSLGPDYALVVEPAWAGVAAPPRRTGHRGALTAPSGVRVAGPATTHAVRLYWAPVAGAGGYHVYRSRAEPGSELSGCRTGLCLSVRDLPARRVSFEDVIDIKPGAYFYTVVAVDADGGQGPRTTIAVEVERGITPAQAVELELPGAGSLQVGDRVRLRWYPLGTDDLGRGLLARLMRGGQVSLFIGVVAPFFFVLLGALYGGVAGFVGGRPGDLLMRLADFVVGLPFLLIMILLYVLFKSAEYDSGVVPMMLAMVLLSWPATARAVRGQVLQIREESYVAAARLLGARTSYMVLRHLLPNTLGIILVNLTFSVPGAIFTEAFLSFIGMGVQIPTPSWGNLLEDFGKFESQPHLLLFPGLCIGGTVLAFNLLGDGLRDALDPGLRSRQ